MCNVGREQPAGETIFRGFFVVVEIPDIVLGMIQLYISQGYTKMDLVGIQN